jgi:chromosome segregation ATPase
VIGDMDTGAFKQMLMEVLAAAIAQQGSALSAIDEQLKGMGYARTKEVAAVTALTEQVKAQDKRLKSLEGDLPAAQAYRASTAAETLLNPEQGAAITAKATHVMPGLLGQLFPELNTTGD